MGNAHSLIQDLYLGHHVYFLQPSLLPYEHFLIYVYVYIYMYVLRFICLSWISHYFKLLIQEKIEMLEDHSEIEALI